MIDRIDAAILELQRTFLEMAERERDLVIPAYTHLRRAQPVLAAHQLLVWCEKFNRDRQRLAECRQRTNIMPLGSAALAGTSLPICLIVVNGTSVRENNWRTATKERTIRS